MARRLLRSWPLAALIIVLGAIVYGLFPDLFACPSCYLFVDGADGLKNYFTPAWFVHHDTGLWFHGMNYPYGEHVVYTDNQPAWSVAMKALDLLFPMGPHVTGAINMMLIVSLVVCGILLYAIMREFGLPRWYAALVSVPMTLLSPQVARIGGHYALAYTFYIPLFLLLFVRWARRPAWGRSLALIIAIVWMGFTHLYFLLIAALFLVSYAGVVLCLNRFRPRWHMLRALVIAVAAGVCVYGTVKLTDPVQDRPVDVYGLYVYSAKAEGTFLPWYQPLNSFWTEELGIKMPDIEGTSYVGIPVTLLFIPLLIWLVLRVLKRRKRRAGIEVWYADPATMCIAAILVWLYASGWLMAIGGEELIDAFPLLGQFRSLGRLAWIFYYVVGLSVAYWAYTQLRLCKGRRAYLVYAGLALLFVAWCMDARGHVRKHIAKEYPVNTIFKRGSPFADLLEAKGLQTRNYQAILSLPLVSVGSEKISIDRGIWVLRLAMQCAWETGLPIMDSNMSRSSVSQALTLLQMLSDPDIRKERLADMDGRPLLLLASDPGSLTDAERRIVDHAQHIGRVEDVDVYTLPVSVFYQSEVRERPAGIVHQTFDEASAEHAMRGSGAFYSSGSFAEMYTLQDTFSTPSTLRYSSWSYIGAQAPFFPVIRHQVRSPDGTLTHDQDYSMFSYEPHNVEGSWVETAFDFAVKGDRSLHTFILQTEGAWVDELRIYRPNYHTRKPGI